MFNIKRVKRIHKKQAYSEIPDLIDKCNEIYNDCNIENKRAKNKFLMINIFIITFFVLTIAYFVINIKEWYGIAFLGMSSFILMVLGIYLNRVSYYVTAEKNIINKVVESINPIFKCSSISDEQIFKEYSSAKFSTFLDRGLVLHNYLNGLVEDNVHVDISNIEVYNSAYPHRNRWYTFKGVFIIIDYENLKDIKIMSKKIKNLNKVEMNKKYELEKYFHILPENLTDLPEELKEFLVEFRNKYKIEFDLIFKDKIYVRFYVKDMFKPKLFGNLINEVSIYQYYAITKFAENIARII